MDKKGAIIGIILVFILILAGAAYFISDNAGVNNVSPTPEPTVDISPTQSISPTDEQDTSDIPENWETYNDTEHNVTLRHPEDAEIRQNQMGSFSVILLGPTQTQGTELFDGYNITVNSGTFTENSLQEFVQDRQQEAEDEPVSEEVGPVQQVTVAGIQGYSYRHVSLGEFTHYYLPKNDNEYLHLSVIVADPGDLRFQETVDTILSSLEF